MTHYNFKNDLKVAQKTETQVAQFVASKHGLKITEWCETKDFDFAAIDRAQSEVRFEIKEDFACKRTGNIAVEYASWGRKSGITTTKADKYIWKIHAPDNTIRVYEMAVEDLRKYITNKAYFREIVGGDVGSESKNYLFTLEFIENNAVLLGYLDE